jgi:hypothetical protein
MAGFVVRVHILLRSGIFLSTLLNSDHAGEEFISVGYFNYPVILIS